MTQNQDRRAGGSALSSIGSPIGRIVAGLFADVHLAKEAVTELKAAGFTDKEIGLAMRDRTEASEPPETVTDTRSTEEAATGAVGGGILGGLTGLLVAAGVVVVPGIGPLLAGARSLQQWESPAHPSSPGPVLERQPGDWSEDWSGWTFRKRLRAVLRRGSVQVAYLFW